MRSDSRFDVLNVLGFLAVVCNATMVVFVGLQVMMASLAPPHSLHTAH